MNLLTRITATGFYTGYLPKMPGTWGSLAAALIWWFLPIDIYLQFILILIVLIIGIIASNRFTAATGTSDPSEIVIDEWVGMWITLFLIPHKIGYFILGFMLFRIFDIAKPLFIKNAEKFPDGWGIMADDVLAGIYSRILLQVGLLLI
ncbi:MAG: phosphatidylglycerophosphatase A [Candidatus Marinimicrobia bacterium]|nr:phosphatidylglycerophosphatase A [Candidatus Neomarinimicrobiota bacterium]